MNPVSNVSVHTSRTVPVPLAAGKVTRVPLGGEAFYIVESDSNAALQIKTDRTNFEAYTVGTGKKFPTELSFEFVEIHNETADDILIEFWVGWGEFIDKRTTIVGNRLSSIMPVMESVTQTFPLPGIITPGTFPASNTIILSGTPDPSFKQLVRKAVTISNNDATADLYINDELGGPVQIIKAGHSGIHYSSGPLQVQNKTAGAISFAGGEIWYVKPPGYVSLL